MRGAVLLAGLLIATAGLGAHAGQATPTPLAYFFAEPGMDLAALSPGGRHVAASGHDGRDRLLLMFDQGHQRRVIARLGNQRVLAIHWATPQRLLVLHAGPGEAPGLLALNRDGSMLQRLIAPGDGSRRQGAGVVDLLPRLPSEVLVTLDQGTPFAPDLLRIDILSGAAEIVERNPGRVLQWFPDAHGGAAAALAWDSGSDGLVYRLLTRHDPRQDWAPAWSFRLGESELLPLGATPDGLLVQIREGDGPTEVRHFDPLRGRFGPPLLSLPGADPDLLRFSVVDGQIALVEYEAERPGRRFLKPEWAAWHARMQAHFGAEAEARLLGLSADETIALVLVSSDRDPGSYWRYDIAADLPRRIGARMPWFRPAAAARTEPVRFTARDGLPLSGYLTRHGGEQRPRPLVLFPHGGPWSRDRFGFDPVVQYFASRGFAVLQVNYRGSRGFGPRFLGKGRGQWGRSMQDDLYDAVDWAIAEGHADPERVLVFGASYGGYAALMAAQQSPRRFAAAVAFAPVTDLPQQIDGWRRLGNLRAEAEWREMVGVPESLSAVSPVSLPAPEIPLLLAHGGRDSRVSIEHSRRYADHAGLSHDRRLWLYQADHQLLPADTAIPFFERLDAFLAEVGLIDAS
jgi:dipeptidyl aminopeptidase/acylaminoacyl peptidase